MWCPKFGGEDIMGRWTNEKQWSYEEIQVYIATMHKHLLNRKNHAYYDMYVLSLWLLFNVADSLTRSSNVVYGRKPR
jgi:hypothetical protein